MSRKRQSRDATNHRLPTAAVSMDLVLKNDDLLTKILLLLSAKSLIRLKPVCKKWLSLISSDYFGQQHTLRRPKLQQSLIIQMHSLQFFYFNQTIDGGKVMIPYTPGVPDHQILQDCNGLLLLEPGHHRDSYYVYNPTTKGLELNLKNSFYVYNPTTRRSRNITLTRSDKFPYVEAINIAFDPSKSPYYKLVCIKSATNSDYDFVACQIEVYDSKSHTWKLSLQPSRCPRILKKSGVHWNNSIFWDTRVYDYDGFFCFDIAKNKIKKLLFPRRYDDSYKNGEFGYLQESNGRLYCFQLLNARECAQVDVWELGGDDHSRWISKYRGAISPRCEQHGLIYPDYELQIKPVRFVGGWAGDGATCTLMTHAPWPEGIMAYNFLDHSYKLLVDLKGYSIDEYTILIKGFQFGETLALV